MRLLSAAIAALCLLTIPVNAQSPGGPDSIFTGEGGKYVRGAEYSRPARGIKPRARIRHKAHAHRGRVAAHRAAGTVYARGGVTARVNPNYARRFQCLVDALEANGYRIRFMGGYRHTKIAGTNVLSKHAFGNALDINQTGRNRVTARLPKNASALAAKCGLYHGSGWSNPDAGHFEVPGDAGWRSQLEDTDKDAPTAQAANLPLETASEKPSDAEFVPVGPLKIAKPAPLRDSDKAAIFQRDEDYNYLCTAYLREPKKEDRSGDFTWKDIAAAKRRGMGLCEFVVGGMSASLRNAVAKTGRALDHAGVKWTILSAFRDDYRQGIASGFKARTGFSLHGGSRVTRGYGDGRAVDVTIIGDREDGPAKAGALFAKYGRKFGLVQPMPGYDAAHIQIGGSRLASHRSSKHWARRGHHRRYASQ